MTDADRAPDADCLGDAFLQLRKYKKLADDAVAQVDDDQLFATLDAESNSIALVMKHMAGNMHSRWRDFLTSDGEKPDRHRDQEFETAASDSSASVREQWESGWRLTLDTLASLKPEDLAQTITIRGEAHTVLQAIHRQLGHYAYHVGQIVLLARHFAGASWRSLSIPKGKSREFDVSRDGKRYSP